MASMVFHLAFNLRTITTVVRDEPNTENQPKYEKKKKKKKNFYKKKILILKRKIKKALKNIFFI